MVRAAAFGESSGTRSAGRRRCPWLRSAAILGALAVLIGSALTAGPGGDAVADEPCTLARTGIHHSLGVDSWDESYRRPDGTVTAVMLFLSFPDADPVADPGDLAAEYFPATSEFFHRASYGAVRLEPHVVPRWARMPGTSRSYGISRDWDPRLRSAYLRDALAAVGPLVDAGAHDIVYLVADPDAPGVDSDATKVVNFERPVEVGGAEISRLVTVFERRSPDRNVLAHETGHLFDLPDLYNRPEGDIGDWDTHVGDWDVMGSQFGLAPELLGWHKWKLGWLGPEVIDCVRGAGTSRHTLEPLGAPLDREYPAGDTRMAVVPLGTHEALVAEARTRTGNDATACTEGVLLYRVRSDVASGEGPVEVLDGHPGPGACHGSSVHPRLADAPLGAGEGFHLVDEGVRVEVGDRTASGGWHLKIVIDPPGRTPAGPEHRD
ncbi:M6 family metalloprotease domain-containing protein [Streptomyces sodiiphilus]|uniref:M6 family metalloprotease domain-containing protein n=1 Tax=Streptomyces sodiiphilus TaxID=226217 RepID=A0ABN2PTR9_9ACTN